MMIRVTKKARANGVPHIPYEGGKLIPAFRIKINERLFNIAILEPEYTINQDNKTTTLYIKTSLSNYPLLSCDYVIYSITGNKLSDDDLKIINDYKNWDEGGLVAKIVQGA